MRKYLVSNKKAVRPNETTVQPDTPTVQDVPAEDFFSTLDTTEDQQFERDDLRSRAKIDFCLAGNACPVEDDRLLRKPGEFCAFVCFQLCRYSCRPIQSPIDLFSRLRRDRNGCAIESDHFDFEAIAAGNATRRVYDDDLPARLIIDLWKQKAYWKLLIDVRDPGTGPFAGEHDAAGAIGTLQVNIAHIVFGQALSFRRPCLFSIPGLVRCFKHRFEGPRWNGEEVGVTSHPVTPKLAFLMKSESRKPLRTVVGNLDIADF